MNSNNLELSLIENEIEKISSRYQLKPQPLTSNQQQLQQVQIQEHQQIKSSQILPFPNNTTINSITNDQTLNRQGFLPMKGGMPKINPKELTNEELEYIIKTGKLPPRLNQVTEQQQQLPFHRESANSQIQALQEKINTINNQNLSKTSTSHPQLHNYLGQGIIQPTQLPDYAQHDFNKENNIIIPLERNQLMNANDQQDAKMKHYSSPRMMTDFLQQSNKNNPFAQNVQQMTTSLDNSGYKTFDNTLQSASQLQPPQSQQQQSQAASQAMKALQDKIKQLENENQFFEDKVQIIESQAKDSQVKLQAKIKEETEKANARETQLKEELNILKRQVETVEQEKLRHLEENSNERDQWRQLNKKLEEDNQQLKKQLHEENSKIQKIEEAVSDIKRREAQLREKYESELQNQKEKVNLLGTEMNDNKERYDKLKQKLQKRNRQLESQVEKYENDYRELKTIKEKEVQQLQREVDKWKREVQMLKEEMSILGTITRPDKDHNQKEETRIKTKSSATPKSSIRCPSPDLKIEVFDSNVKKEEIRKKKNKVSKGSKDSKSSNNKASQIVQTPQGANLINSKCRSSQKDTLQKTQPLRVQQSENKNRLKTSSQKSTSRTKKSCKKKRNLSSKNLIVEKTDNDEKFLKDKTLNGAQSVNNLISINTKKGKAETVIDTDKNESYIYIESQKEAKRTMSEFRQQDFSKQQYKGFNQYKRSSIESSSNKNLHDYGVSSQQSDAGYDFISSRPLDLDDINIDNKPAIDNQIFYLEREIFDYNQQYKTLLSQQYNSQMESHRSQNSTNSTNINQKLRQIAQMLEEKSERLFDLKKQQQQLILKESLKDKNQQLNMGALSMQYQI